MLSNAYFLAKFRFDTAENEPAKNLQNFANFSNFANPNPADVVHREPGLAGRVLRGVGPRRRRARLGAVQPRGRPRDAGLRGSCYTRKRYYKRKLYWKRSR